ncbi:MAG: hypothetical protein AAGD22_18185, partial [Verrucomicrobiota bacterium]
YILETSKIIQGISLEHHFLHPSRIITRYLRLIIPNAPPLRPDETRKTNIPQLMFAMPWLPVNAP